MAPETKIDTSDERAAFDLPEDKTEKDDKESEETEENTEEEPEDDETDSEDSDESKDEDDEPEDDKEESAEDEVDEEDTLYQQIKKTSPELFKKVPELKRVIFREQAFTQVFPTVEEAKEASEQVANYNQMQTDILAGESEKLLKALNKIDSEGDGTSLKDFAANFIPSLEKVNKDLYFQVLYPEFKKLFRAAVNSGDKALQISAKNLNWFVFNDDGVDKDAGLKPKVRDEREEKFSKREQELEDRLSKGFVQDIVGVTKGRTLKVISNAFKDSGLSDWQQKKLSDDIFQRVDQALVQDRRHMGLVNQLYKEARRAGFTSDFKDRITNTYLSRAKLLIPKIRQQVLTEAKVNAKISESKPDKKKVTRITGSNVSRPVGTTKVDPKKVDYSKTTERDLLEGKFVERK